jgi:hypothetical protein
MIRYDFVLSTWRAWDERIASVARTMKHGWGQLPDLVVMNPITHRRLSVAMAAKRRKRYELCEALSLEGRKIHVIEESDLADNTIGFIIVEGSDQLGAA